MPRLINENGKNSYEMRVLSDTKVPKFVRGEYIDQNIKVDGKNIPFKYDKQRKTGVYATLDGKPVYIAERNILKETSLKIAARANAAEPKETKEKPVKQEKTKKTPNGEE